MDFFGTYMSAHRSSVGCSFPLLPSFNRFFIHLMFSLFCPVGLHSFSLVYRFNIYIEKRFAQSCLNRLSIIFAIWWLSRSSSFNISFFSVFWFSWLITFCHLFGEVGISRLCLAFLYLLRAQEREFYWQIFYSQN